MKKQREGPEAKVITKTLYSCTGCRWLIFKPAAWDGKAMRMSNNLYECNHPTESRAGGLIMPRYIGRDSECPEWCPVFDVITGKERGA